MENCEVMTSATHSFAYSYRLVKKCFVEICETSKCHNFLIFQPIFIRFSLLCLKFVTLSSEIKLNLLWSSSLISTRGLAAVPEIRIFTLKTDQARSGAPHFRSKRLKIVPEPRIFKLKTAQARSGAPHFHARPGARSGALQCPFFILPRHTIPTKIWDENTPPPGCAPLGYIFFFASHYRVRSWMLPLYIYPIMKMSKIHFFFLICRILNPTRWATFQGWWDAGNSVGFLSSSPPPPPATFWRLLRHRGIFPHGKK